MDDSKSRELENLYYEHKDMVFRIGLRFSRGNEEWAMDRVQEVFLRLAEKWESLPQIENYKAFIYRTTMNLCINKVRRQKNILHLMTRFFNPSKEIPTALGSPLPAPDSVAAENQDLRLLDDAIAALPPKIQATVIMYYLEDIEIPAIARILGINKGTVSRRLKTARGKLAELLGERWFQENGT